MAIESPSSETLAAWAASSRELLALTAPDGTVLWCNAAFRQRFGTVLPAPLRIAPPTRPDEEIAIGDDLFAARAHAVPDGTAWQLEDLGPRREAARLRELLDIAQEFGRLGLWEREIGSGRGRWDRHVFDFWGLDASQGTPDLHEATRFIHPDDQFADTFGQSMAVPGRYSQHYRVLRPDGTVCRIHSQWEVKAGPSGRPERVVGVMMDDTEVYELARSLGDASAQLKLAVELADIAIWRHDLRTDRMHYNDRAFAVLGIEPRPDGLSIDEVRSYIHPDDLPEVIASAQRALASDRPTDMQARYRRSDGSWRHVLTRRVVQRGPDGAPLAFLGVALDLTDQVENQREATELALRLEMATSAAGVGIWTRDPQTEAGEWNAEMFALNGLSPDRGVPSRREWVEEIIHPDDRPRMRHVREQLLESPEGMVEHEYRIVRPDGQVRWLVNRARRMPWGGRTMIFGVTLDITERRQAEQALRSSDQRAALAVRSAGIGTWEVDFESGTERWDEQMFRLRGLEPRREPPSREDRLAMVHPADRSRTMDARPAAVGERRPLRYEFRITLPDGSVRWLASRSIAVTDEQGRALRRIGVNWDITDAKETEAARAATAVAERASRAKSQFLARMSHELRTPLNAVLGFTQLLQFEDTDPARSAKLRHVRAAGEHLLSLIDGVLDLSSLEAGNLRLRPEPIDLAALADQALPLVSVLGQRHGVRLLRGPVDGVAMADRTRTLQVLMNLLTNAIKYNRPGGEVRLSARADGADVTFSVADTGRGMNAEQLRHLFEPFNRLGAEREGIEGTGIGLTIVKALVHGMSGQVAVHSEPGVGSRFDVTLPRAAAGAEVSSMPEPVASTPRRSRRRAASCSTSRTTRSTCCSSRSWCATFPVCASTARPPALPAWRVPRRCAPTSC
ncbi:PAS domain S-box protein [Piscinibacter aquaticus]|uniref:histidine kinase n=1 Tax=Piscinibacter aquaticus TaxID=392597 RepID=A0A5C6U0Q2_9BURK|nr:PAS domain S-box protein [Piscinibacter aquaticus]